MNIDFNNILNLVSKFIFRKKILYKWVASIVLLSIITELGTFALPEELHPDYEMIKNEYGWLLSVVLSFVVGKFAGGYNLTVIGVKLLILFSCLIVEYKINASQAGEKSILKFIVNNFNLGLFNKSVTTTNYYNHEDGK